MSLRTLPLSIVDAGDDLMPRAMIDPAHLAEIAAAYRSGDRPPPPIVFHDGAGYYLAAGHYRYRGALAAGLDALAFIVKEGTRTDAMLFAAGQNQGHPLKRSDVDRRKAVLMAIAARPAWKDAEVAGHCGVGLVLVKGVRLLLRREAEAPPAPAPAPAVPPAPTPQERIEAARASGGNDSAAAVIAGQEREALARADTVLANQDAKERAAALKKAHKALARVLQTWVEHRVPAELVRRLEELLAAAQPAACEPRG